MPRATDDATVVGEVTLISSRSLARIVALAIRQSRRDAQVDGATFLGGLVILQDRLLDAVSGGTQQGPGPDSTDPKFDRSEPAGRGLTEITGVAAVMTSMEVAALVGCSDRSVRRAASAGRLSGQRTWHGRQCGWEFTPKAVQQWQAKRLSKSEE